MRRATHTPATRDAAMRRLARSKRWLLAGTAALTAALTAVAANAFPGRTGTARSPGSSDAGPTRANQTEHSGGGAHDPSLQAPSQEPQAAPGEGGPSGSGQPESTAPQAAPPESGSAGSGSSQEAAPPQSSPSQESAPAAPATSQPETTAPSAKSPEAPVVSGGS